MCMVNVFSLSLGGSFQVKPDLTVLFLSCVDFL